MGIPVPSRMTFEEVVAAERFSRRVFGGPMFDHSPAHRGQHVGRNYPDCLRCLEVIAAEHEAKSDREAEVARVRQIQQPWELAA